MSAMNIFDFNMDTIKELKEGDVFLFYEKRDGAWSPDSRLMIYQGLAAGNNIRLCFRSPGDKKFYEAPDLDTLSRRTAVKLLPGQHPEVVKIGLRYDFSA